MAINLSTIMIIVKRKSYSYNWIFTIYLHTLTLFQQQPELTASAAFPDDVDMMYYLTDEQKK